MLEARPGKTTLKMAYFFSGVKREASIAEQLIRRCAKQGLGLIIFEIDVLVGGEEHSSTEKPRTSGWPGSRTASSTSWFCLPCVGVGAEPTGPTTTDPSHAGIEPSHGASLLRRHTSRSVQRRA